MFDLEKAIAVWRCLLEHHRAFSGEDLEELERSHRERVEETMSIHSTTRGKSGKISEAARSPA